MQRNNKTRNIIRSLKVTVRNARTNRLEYVYHGRVEEEKSKYYFLREIPWHYLRHDEDAFCINTAILPLLEFVDFYEFKYYLAHGWILYRIEKRYGDSFAKKINEYGEENLRIPRSAGRVVEKFFENEKTEKEEIKRPEIQQLTLAFI